MLLALLACAHLRPGTLRIVVDQETATVVFTGKGPVPVRYLLTYRGDRLVSEVWQIDPALAK